MKILIDPTLALLVKDFSDAQCAELFRCILEYPNRDCDLGVWKYMRKQIEEDEKKYLAKCERMAEIRGKKLTLKPAVKTTQKPTLISEQESSVEEEKENENTIQEKEIVGGGRGNAEKIVEKPREFLVDNFFSFQALGNAYPKFNDYLNLFPLSVIERAEETFIRKRQGHVVSMRDVLEWLEKQNAFYKKDKGL